MINFVKLDTKVVTLEGCKCHELDITKCHIHMASGVEIVHPDNTTTIRIFECPESLEPELLNYFTTIVGAKDVLFYKSKNQVCGDVIITVCAWCNRLTDKNNVSYGQEISKKAQLSHRMSHGICQRCATTFARRNKLCLSKLNLVEEARYEY